MQRVVALDDIAGWHLSAHQYDYPEASASSSRQPNAKEAVIHFVDVVLVENEFLVNKRLNG